MRGRHARGGRLLGVLLAVVLALTGCSAPAPPASGNPDARSTLTVFAAASLTEVFTELGTTFEADHPGVSVQFSFLGSSTLVDQLVGGAPADVFASANETQMDRAVSEGVVGEPTLFAGNVLTLVVAPGNPLGITGLDDSLDGTKLVTCASEVPCGAATDELSTVLGATLSPVSREQKVTDVLGKVTSGEADAGVVYVTDARRAAAEVEEVPIARAEEVVNRYPIAVTTEAPQPELAQEFVDLVTSDVGRRVLDEAGFSVP